MTPWDDAFCEKEEDLKMYLTMYELGCVEPNSVHDRFFMYLYNVFTNWWLALHFGKGVALEDDFEYGVLQKKDCRSQSVINCMARI